MVAPIKLDLVRLRRGCAQCSLRELCLPAGIAADDMSRLDDIVRRRRPVERGDRLFRMGDPMSSVFVARSGAFKTVTVSEDGEEQVLGFHLAGDLIGLDALGGGAHRCEAIGLTHSDVCEIPFEELTRVATRLPSLHRQLLKVMGQCADRDHDHMDILVRRQAGERIALFLRSLGERYLRVGQSELAFILPMSREDIARYLGLAFETVSRGFTRLQDDGVIRVRARHVQILDHAALERLADVPDPPPAVDRHSCRRN